MKILPIIASLIVATSVLAQQQDVRGQNNGAAATYFSFLAIGEIPPVVIKSSGKSFSYEEIPENAVPPRVLFYKPDSLDKKKSSQVDAAEAVTGSKKGDYKAMGISFNCATAWIKNEQGKSSLELLKMLTAKDGAVSYNRYLSAALTENSKAAVFVLYNQENAKNWDRPQQMIIPVEEFLNPDYTRKEAVLIINLLTQPIQFQMDGKRGILRAGGRSFVPLTRPDKSKQFSFQIMKGGKLTDIGTASFTPLQSGASVFFAYRNPYARKGEDQETVARCSFNLPPLTSPLSENSAK